MDARTLAERLVPVTFRGTYHREAEIYADLKRALVAAAGPEGVVHVQQQDRGVLRPVQAFAQAFWPDGVVRLGDRSIVVEAKLLRHRHESGALCSAIGQAMILRLDHDEALIVLLQTDNCPAFSARERGLLDRLWPSDKIATAIVPVGVVVRAEV